MTANENNIVDTDILETLATIVERSPDYRVLRALDIQTTAEPPPNMFDDVSLLVLDVETNGLDPATSKIIEIAMRPIVIDDIGAVVRIDESISFLEDPGAPLPPEIVALTGLTDEDLRDRRIDDEAVRQLFENAHFVIAHNANFDRPFIEKRFPALPLRPWACSCNGLDWRSEGFEGKSLNALLMQTGLFQSGDAHRAANDVDALIGILMAKLAGERTVAGVLIETAKKPTLLFEATGSHFDTKDALKSRGYRWNSPRTVWAREVLTECREQEELWLAAHVYAPTLKAKADGPTIYPMTALQRYSGRLP